MDLEEKLKNMMASRIVTDKNRAAEAESRLMFIEKQAVRDRHRLELISSRLDGFVSAQEDRRRLRLSD